MFSIFFASSSGVAFVSGNTSGELLKIQDGGTSRALRLCLERQFTGKYPKLAFCYCFVIVALLIETYVLIVLIQIISLQLDFRRLLIQLK